MTRVLTGIKPTGQMHLGNYVGAIRPALARAERADSSFFFMADLHALNQVNDERLKDWTYSVAASWLSSGLDPEISHVYRQSDLPEVLELAVQLTAFTPKGWMNKAHAYKAAVDQNRTEGNDSDADVNMGLYTYPILMAADIMIVDSDLVPVGKDQIQHIEICRDIADRINSNYGSQILVPPEYELEAAAHAIPGTDGRKMSKSYDNVIPLFTSKKQWKNAIYSIMTDSTERHEPKSTAGAAVYEIYAALATQDQASDLKSKLEAGEIGWGDAKAALLDLVEAELGERSERYEYYMAHTNELDRILEAGAEKARPYARATLQRVRQAIGFTSNR